MKMLHVKTYTHKRLNPYSKHGGMLDYRSWSQTAVILVQSNYCIVEQTWKSYLLLLGFTHPR